MTGQERTAPELANLLERNQNEIALAWAEKVHNLPYSHYFQVPLKELVGSLSLGLAATIDSLKTGSPQAVEVYLKEVALIRLEAGFDISEVLGALLMLRDAALPVVLRTYSANPNQATLGLNQLDASLRYMTARLASLFAEGVERRGDANGDLVERLARYAEGRGF